MYTFLGTIGFIILFGSILMAASLRISLFEAFLGVLMGALISAVADIGNRVKRIEKAICPPSNPLDEEEEKQ